MCGAIVIAERSQLKKQRARLLERAKQLSEAQVLLIARSRHEMPNRLKDFGDEKYGLARSLACTMPCRIVD